MSKMESLYREIVKHLQSAYASVKWAEMRSRYDYEHYSQIKKEAEDFAKEQWFKAKVLYCENKEQLDIEHKTINVEYFTDMTKVIENEMTEELENSMITKKD